MTTKTIREIALVWKIDKQRYVKQSTYAAYVLVLENHGKNGADCYSKNGHAVTDLTRQS